MDVLTDTKLQGFLSHLNLVPKTNAQIAAVQALEKLDFPTTREEYYKYTRLNKIANAKLNLGKTSGHFVEVEKLLVSDQFVIIENGVFRADLSSFDLSEVAVNIENISDMSETTAKTTDLFQMMNVACHEQTVYITIPADTKWDETVQIIFVTSTSNTIANTHLIIESGVGSEANIITNFINTAEENTFSNHFTEVLVAENAHITLDKLQVGSGWYVATENVQQSANSTFKINTITLKGDIVRNKLNIEV